MEQFEQEKGEINMPWPDKDFYYGRWKTDIDNDTPLLRCPDCGGRVFKKEYEFAIGLKGMRFCPYCGSDLWHGQSKFAWTPNLPLFKPEIGLHIVTVNLYDQTAQKVIGRTTSAANYHFDGHWIGIDDSDVLAYADLPEPYKE